MNTADLKLHFRKPKQTEAWNRPACSVFQGRHNVVARVADPLGETEEGAEALARLFAHAPELIDTFEQTLDWLDQYAAKILDSQGMSLAEDIGGWAEERALIARARGRA